MGVHDSVDDSIDAIKQYRNDTYMGDGSRKTSLTKKKKTKIFLLNLYQSYFTSIIFRLLFVIESFILIHYAICIEESYYFLLLSIFILLIIADGFYVLYIRNGVEHGWFSVSVASYTIIYIVTIWLLTFYKFRLNDTLCKRTLLTLRKHDLCFKVYKAKRALVQKPNHSGLLEDLTVQIVLICFAIGRWNMRIPKLNREAHIEMVLMLICACSDCSDFFNYINAPHVKDHLGLVLLILIVFTISTFQFSVTLTRHYELPRRRVLKPQQTDLQLRQKLYEVIFCTKVWSILFLMLTQDLPYFVVRIALLCTANLELDRTIYLFTVKNALLIYFDVYQIYYIQKNYRRDLKKSMKMFAGEIEMIEFVDSNDMSKKASQ